MKNFAVMERLGWPGVVGALLLVACIVLYAAATAPARAERDGLNAEKDRLAAAAQAGRPAAAPALAKPPPFAQAPELLKQLNALAQKDGVTVVRTSYAVKDEDSRRIFAVDLPLKVAYPTLRAYLRDVLALSPTARLDDLDLHRAQASDPAIDADVRLSFSFAVAAS